MGRTQSIQLYLKEYEFLKHGYKKLLKLGQKDLANQILMLSQEVLRFEVRLFKQSLQTIFKKKIITCNDIINPTWYFNYLDECLTKLLKTPNKYTTLDFDAILKFKHKFKEEKAMRLFFFWKSFYLDEATNKYVRENFNSTTISRNMKDIASTGVGIATPLDFPKLFNLSIPSVSVVNSTNIVSTPVGVENEIVV
jgi:hypothetical protein